ncbi:MAG: substrate-binding domain-containing protein [Pseudolabrys sp.]
MTAVDIKILSTHAAMDVLGELGPKFERASGHRLSFSYDPAKAVRRRIESGDAFDIAIVTRPVFDILAAACKLVAESRADIGRSGLGVSVRKGAAKPDIGTVDAFTRALLNATSVVRSTEGTSGMYFETLLDRLGIAQVMRGKIVLGPSGRVAELVARGEAELAVQQIAELLPVAGTDYVGPFPPDLQLYSVFSAGVAATSPQRDACIAFIDTLITPAAIALFTASGLEPVPR